MIFSRRMEMRREAMLESPHSLFDLVGQITTIQFIVEWNDMGEVMTKVAGPRYVHM